MSVADRWRETLRGSSAYEHNVGTSWQPSRWSRLWRRIFRHTNFGPAGQSQLTAFEVGCGGGKHLCELALNGWTCVGIDCSDDVLQRARRYINEVFDSCKKEPHVKFISGDFLDYVGSEKFDLVFHVGVLEHFLDDAERLRVLHKMFDMTKPNGYVISIVPSGMHPLRAKMKEYHLGGYDIPEIDYDCQSMFDEMKQCRGEDILVLPHNIFDYVLLEVSAGILKKLWYYLWQVVPISLLPKTFAYRHAGSLIGIARKPAIGFVKHGGAQAYAEK